MISRTARSSFEPALLGISTHGQVEIVQERRDGETESVAVLRRGEYFGEMGAIDEKPRSASAIR
jgi:CRP-like cAMP-binding protein